MASDVSPDLLYGILGVLVALWSFVMCWWRLRASSQREAAIFAAMGKAVGVAYWEQRAQAEADRAAR